MVGPHPKHALPSGPNDRRDAAVNAQGWIQDGSADSLVRAFLASTLLLGLTASAFCRRRGEILDRDDVKRIDRLNQPILAQQRDDSFAKQYEFGMGNVEFATVGEVKRKWPKALLKPQLDLIQIHDATVSPQKTTRQANRQSPNLNDFQNPSDDLPEVSAPACASHCLANL